ncbi:MAG: GspE/PulE family protein [Patescibacteria group bacterium]|nr:GspE/PulE family protein [Patescibacteria group bacterium]MCL5093707.1 GspE/PulE family protein [Patescibacteria group bacterium]
MLDQNNQKNAQAKTQELYRDGQERVIRDRAFEMGVKYFDARKLEIPSDTLALFSKEEVEQYKTIPLHSKGPHLILGSLNPHSEFLNDLFESLKSHFKNIELALISEPSFNELLSKYQNITKIELDKRDNTISLDIKVASFEELNQRLQTAPIQELLKLILFSAVSANSSDVHIEPQEKDALIRFRIDGLLHEIARLDNERFKVLLSQIELKSGVKLGANFPQKGRFEVISESGELSIRIETLPSLYGDDIVIRIFNTRASMLDLKNLGILDEKFHIINESLARPHGMILVVGPTGSGKTSTIYAMLNKLNTPEVKIVTLEDPIEYALTGVVQSQINEGESFADRLKAVLREDPDIIMVGEIRDKETAETALQAALTGHLVISTLHANNAITSIVRLADLSSDPATITTVLNLIVAQRLVRRVCIHCKTSYTPTEIENQEINRILKTFPAEKQQDIKMEFFKGEGCEKCNHIGYQGRVGIFELLGITPELQRAIIAKMPIYNLQQLAIENGMMTMEQDGLIKVSQGVTTIQELMRAIKE